MSKVGFNRKGGARRVLPLLAVLSAALLSGCTMAHRDSITVGAVPDDYRTNHPIVISEQEETLDVPVGAYDRAMTQQQGDAIAGFMDRYDRTAGSPVYILVPADAQNSYAATRVAHDAARLLRSVGVPQGRIYLQSYRVSQPGALAPIRLSYSAMKASAGQCGRWPNDLLDSSENKHYADYGCSYQHNLAAQVANPADLLGPRKSTSIDPENRENAVAEYKARGVAADFKNNSEVDY